MAQELYAAQAHAGKRTFLGDAVTHGPRASTKGALVIYPDADDFRFGIAGALVVVVPASLERGS
jgi:hypothetical protein